MTSIALLFLDQGMIGVKAVARTGSLLEVSISQYKKRFSMIGTAAVIIISATIINVALLIDIALVIAALLRTRATLAVAC